MKNEDLEKIADILSMISDRMYKIEKREKGADEELRYFYLKLDREIENL